MKKFAQLLVTLIFVSATSVAFSQEFGLASYYSDKFQGKPTASGVSYDKKKFTAAHKTLPFGTIIKVTRLDSGKSVTVKVNDRGPYIGGRIVDLSRAAAEKIDLIIDGTTQVKVEVVDRMTNEEVAASSNKKKETKKKETKTENTKKESSKVASANANQKKAKKPSSSNNKKTTTANNGSASTVSRRLVTAKDYKDYDLYKIELSRPASKGYGVQVASLSNYENVLKQVADLQGKFFKNILLSIEPGSNGKPIYKIILGPFDTPESANSYKKSVTKKTGIKGFVVNLDEIEY